MNEAAVTLLPARTIAIAETEIEQQIVRIAATTKKTNDGPPMRAERTE